MRKNLILISGLGIVALLLISASLNKSSSGAPPSHTGAPGEMTCAASGCHDDNSLNTGTAQLEIELGNKEASVIPGKTYPVKIRIRDKEVSRFGFQLVALASESSDNCGELQICDSLRTKLVANAYKLQNRKYATYTFNGTDAVKEGMSEWVVNWTAPADLEGGVSFYVSAVSANDDMYDKGDHVYTCKLNINRKKN